MSDQIAGTPEQSAPKPQPESFKRAKEAASVASLTALFALAALAFFPSWPLAIGVVAVSIMAVGVCYLLLKHG